MPGLMTMLLWAVSARAAGGLLLEIQDPTEVLSAANLEAFSVADGHASGQSRWDPYVYLRLPKDGLDVSGLPYLTVRLYSSADADVLDVFYKCPDGRWGLGRTLAVKLGWATYRADLRKAGWTEGGMAEDARQWGGVSKRIVSFRLDPGNEAGRWIVLDRVELSSEPTGPDGITLEPRGRATESATICPPTVTAGETLPVVFTCRVEALDGPRQGTALLRVMSGGTPVMVHQEAVDVTTGALRVAHEFATSKYSFGGEYTVAAEILELDSAKVATAPVRVSNPRIGTVKPAEARVADYRGEPTLYVNGEPRPLITYLHHGGAHGVLHRQAAAAGLKVYTDWFGASMAGDLGQIAPGKYDYGAFDAYFTSVLDAVPDAYFLPHIGVTAPTWWQTTHPEECCLYSNGLRGPSSFASELWKREMGEDLRKLIAHLRQAPYADRILGYLFYNGYTAEWQMWATWQEYSDDYSQPALRAWREWLSARYGTDAALQQAWGDAKVTLATATPPTHEQRRESAPFLRDPAQGRQVIDYNRFICDMTADAVRYFARVTKEACGGTQLAGTYYGYMAAHGARQQLCGHNALARVLACPDVDILMSPNMYANRNLGETSTFMSATESVKLHGKLWFDEADLRTYLSDPASGYGRTDTARDSVAVAWREFANVLTRHVAMGWFDMGGGWFSGELMWDAYRRQLQVMAEAFPRREPFRADVAVFVDEDSYDYYRYNQLHYQMVEDVIAHLPQAGVTWDCYLLSDLGDPKLPDYRLYVLLNACALGDATNAALMAKAKRNGATVMYCYAPGAVAEGRLDATRISKVTGIDVRLEATGGSAAYRLESTADLATGLPADAVLGPELSLAPRPLIVDPEAKVLARYVDGGGAALARKTHEGVPVVYCASVAMPYGLTREIARVAGAHVWCESGDSIYTDGQYLALHAASDGEKIIRLPWIATATDVLTGEQAAVRAGEVRRTMRRGETLMVRLER